MNVSEENKLSSANQGDNIVVRLVQTDLWTCQGVALRPYVLNEALNDSGAQQVFGTLLERTLYKREPVQGDVMPWTV